MARIYEILFLNILIFFVYQIAQAQELIRDCTKKDLIGTWEVTHIKVLDKDTAEDSYFDLMEENQIRIYKENNSLWTASSNKDLADVVEILSKFPQDDFYTIKDSTIFTHRKSKGGKVVDKYRCDYFVYNFEKAKIKEGSISLIWYRNNIPIIANVYFKKP